jgi:DNA polymerase-3 subunit gamma/tau
LKQDSIAYEPAGVWLIAEAARGSVRDGLSLLEQAVLLSVGCMTGISAAGVRSQLGCGSERDIWSLLAAIAHSDVRAVLALSQQLSDQSVDFIEVLSQLLHALYQLALYQQVPDVSLTLALDLQPMLKQLALEVPPEAVQLYYQIALLAEDDLKRAPDFKMGFEMALLRMLAFAPQSGGGSTVPPPLQSDPLIAPIMPNQPVSAPLKPASTVPRDTTITEYQSTAGDQNWSEWIETLGLHGLALSLLRHTQKIEQDAQTLRLALAPQAASLLNQNTQQAIEMAVRRFLGESIQVQIEVAASASTIETPAKTHQAAAVLHQEEVRADMQRNPHIQAILDAFNGELKVDSI